MRILDLEVRKMNKQRREKIRQLKTQIDFLGEYMRRKEYKSCKRKNCPYYNEITRKCESCEWNRNSTWTEIK